MFTPRNSKVVEKSFAFLSETKVWLTILDKFLNGTPIPSGVAGAAVELIRLVENVKKHQEECFDIAQLVYQITEGILEATAGMKEDEMNQKLVGDLKSFTQTLDRMKAKLGLLTKRSTLALFLRQGNMMDILTNFKNELRNQIDLFNIRHGISMQSVMNTQFERLNVKLDNIECKVLSSAPQAVDIISISSVLPPPPAHFYGRNSLVQEAIEVILRSANTGSPARIPIMGTGGIGKTTISRAIAHSQRICAYFQSNRYFVACDTVLTVQTLVQELLVTFRVPSNSQDPLADLLQSLGSMGPCLLILDNFETPWDNAEQKNGLTTLLGHLHSLTNLTLIVTMRGKVRPDGVSWSTLSLTSLPPLDVNAACNAFTAVAGINHFDEDELRTLMEILDCVPLAITLMAKQAEVRGNISDLISQWNVDRTSMLVADQVGDRLLNVEYSIQLSVESSRMKQCPEAFTLLQIISMLPNGLHKVHLNTLAAGSLGRMTTRAAHVIQEVELAYQDRERLKVLSPIRAYVQSRHPLDREKALEIKRFYWDLVGKYSEDVSETGDITMIEPDLLHAEMGNLSYLLTTALSEEDVDEDVVQATYDLTMLFYWTTPSNELLQILLDKPELSCDPLLKAKCFQLHSDIASRTGHLHQAVASVASAQDLFEAMGNHLGVAQCLQSLGDMAKVQNNHKTATNYFSSAMELFRLEDGQLGYTQSLLSLAQMECIAGNYDNANKLFQEALSHFRGLEDKVGSAQCLIGLGEVAQAQDHYPIALERYTLAREQFLLIGHAAGANQCLQSLAGTAAMQSRFGRAISQFLQAKNQFHKVGDILGEMQCIQALGDIARLQGRGSDAREFLRTSRLFFARFGDNMASSQCIQALGDVAIDEGDYALGRDFLRKAMAFYDTINRRLERAQCRMSLGRAARKEGELEQPEKYLSLSLAEFRDIKERRGAADCVRQFGLLHWAKGDYTKALTDFKYALSEYEEMGNDLGIAECQEHMGIFLEGTDAKESRAMLQEALLGFEKTGMQKKYERCQVRLRSLQERPMPGEFNINSGQEGVETERVKGTNFTSVTLLPLVVVVACSLVF